ncbi:MAG: hypothetical protein LBN95_06645 [Prevotellaceae bacterium]|nr:hypothetical protein [Prevotellaceae bacterium]
MNSNFSNTTFQNSYTIYIVQENDNAEYQIGYAVNDCRDVARHVSTNEKNLVYLRMFDDFVDALGHKLFLENISTPSLRRFIRLHNNQQGGLPPCYNS